MELALGLERSLTGSAALCAHRKIDSALEAASAYWAVQFEAVELVQLSVL